MGHPVYAKQRRIENKLNRMIINSRRITVADERYVFYRTFCTTDFTAFQTNNIPEKTRFSEY